ncbi:hypothetical protein TPHA_0G02490 [Tetrapisispora phaffii CBS 4417]|uniref:B30.2/SPRY domain-containing protein n=1 Tax=Tetrapisispora phaffii (strain ATCC 24235 / CBS 4417 / NBRC 1672 / NRRL Y-8282 / UCD 70-5) TaxID=1071381 RepID=G8BW06_TETPH|nr:hypothetical protein TPHA_0G02490 [Tetrapisispora phaffii CBS 4417]CCE64084.1 hypothetical protein TPHA_0G02490 [Tetrapisispora phaffii CBS 4417]
MIVLDIAYNLDQVTSAVSQEAYPINEPYPAPPVDRDSDTVSLAFLISLSVTFALLMIFLLAMAIYVMFCGVDEAAYDEETGAAVASNSLNISSFFGSKGSILLDSNFTDPGQFDDDAALQELEETELLKMSPFEIELYNRTKTFNKVNPPVVHNFGTFLNDTDKKYIKDRGIQSYYFYPSINDNVDEEGNFLPSFLVQDKLDVSFTQFNKSSSTLLNYPLPNNKKDAVYFEVKVYKFSRNSNAVFSIGLVTTPYPYFKIPGTSSYSIAYESTGKLRINNPFSASTLLPKLQEGDVVGFGYRYKLGTIFITHNGKKMMDVTHNVGIDLFVSLGCLNASYTRTYTKDGLLEDPDNVSLRDALSNGQDIDLPDTLKTVFNPSNDIQVPCDELELQVNLGQVGFVFVEANVKKYAFGSLNGDIGIPPSYNGENFKKNAIIQKGDELPPNYFVDDTEEDIFFGNIHINEGKGSSSRHLGGRETNANYVNKTNNHNNMNVEEMGSYERKSSAFDKENNFYRDLADVVLKNSNPKKKSYDNDIAVSGIQNNAISNIETYSDESLQDMDNVGDITTRSTNFYGSENHNKDENENEIEELPVGSAKTDGNENQRKVALNKNNNKKRRNKNKKKKTRKHK